MVGQCSPLVSPWKSAVRVIAAFILSAGSGCALLDQRQCSTSLPLNRFSIDGINATCKSQTHWSQGYSSHVHLQWEKLAWLPFQPEDKNKIILILKSLTDMRKPDGKKKVRWTLCLFESNATPWYKPMLLFFVLFFFWMFRFFWESGSVS